MKNSAYQLITNQILMLLQEQIVPWRQPWKARSQWPRNLISQRLYQGINMFLLHARNYESPFWLTFNQASQLGGTVRKNEKATPIVLWKRIETAESQSQEKHTTLLVRRWSVFNSAQCDGLSSIVPTPAVAVAADNPVASASRIVQQMPDPPLINHGFREAKYLPLDDCVAMPLSADFESLQKYYGVLFHELGHATGHEKRLNRKSLREVFGDDPSNYPKEELCAEMTSAFLCGECGIVEQTVGSSAAYIQHWLKQLKSDPKLVVHAAAQAQKAADYILNRRSEDEQGEISFEKEAV